MKKVLSVSNDRGQVLLLTAFSMVALIGMAALALDIGYAYDVRSRLASSADAAAKSAAYEIWRSNGSNYLAYGQRSVTDDIGAGRIPATTASTIRLCSDVGATCNAAFHTNKYVEVILQETHNTFLGSVLGMSTLAPAGRAVAGTSSGPNCIITLGGSPSLSIGNSTITSPNCGVAAGGNVQGTNPNSTISASSVSGTSCLNNCSNITPFTANAPPPSDPLAGLVAPAACSGSSIIVGGGTWSSGCYTSVDLSGTVTMGSGTFVVSGAITLHNNTHITGTDVTVYMSPTATIDWGQHSSLDLTAPSSGAYNGIAFFMDPANTSAFTMKNNSDLSINGAFYAPGSDVTIGNSVGNAGNCSLIVVHSLDIGNGNGHLDNTCSGFGGSPLTTVSLAE